MKKSLLILMCIVAIGCGTRKVNLEKKEVKDKVDGTHLKQILRDSTYFNQVKADSTNVSKSDNSLIKSIIDSIKKDITTNKSDVIVMENYNDKGDVTQRKTIFKRAKIEDKTTIVNKQQSLSKDVKQDSTNNIVVKVDSIAVKDNTKDSLNYSKDFYQKIKTKTTESIRTNWQTYLLILVVGFILGKKI